MIDLKRMQDGFTAVELLITLFIASIFLLSGYQLFVQVNRDGAESDRISRVSNIVYRALRVQSGKVTTNYPGGCNPSDFTNDTTEQASSGGIKVSMTVRVRCPATSSSGSGYLNTYHITVTGVYKDAGVERTVTHATFTNG